MTTIPKVPLDAINAETMLLIDQVIAGIWLPDALDRPQRRVAMQKLRDRGWSAAKIAGFFGCSPRVVQRWSKAVGQ